MNSVSVIIPHRGNILGVWATVHSTFEQLRRLDIPYEIVVVSNGEPTSTELRANLEGVRHVHVEEALPPPLARQVGVDNSTGDLIFFFDNHCLVTDQYFRRGMHHLSQGGLDMLHSAYRFNIKIDTHYHYRLKLDYNFWGEGATSPEDDLRPYRIGVGGHGGFAVKRSVWEDVGGYGPRDLLVGYGGEEVLFDLKMWLFGYQVHLDPLMLHYHYAGNRGYIRHFTDEYYVNMMCCAHVIGGEKWLYRLFDSFVTKVHLRFGNTHWFDLLETAFERSRNYAELVRARQVMDLDELLCKFRREQVAH